MFARMTPNNQLDVAARGNFGALVGIGHPRGPDKGRSVLVPINERPQIIVLVATGQTDHGIR